MQVKNDILDELRSLSALIAGIERQTPYELPEGYFEGLPPLILREIMNRIAEPDGGTLASNLPKSSTFSIPDGYFDNFASQVLGRIKAGSAHKDFLGGRAQEGVQEELAGLSAVLSRITRETPYRLPEGYFEEVSPVLSILKDKTTYLAPEGYFDYLPAATTAAVMAGSAARSGSAAGGAKVIGIGKGGSAVRGQWWKYAGVAAAACVILVFSWPQVHQGSSNMNGGKADGGQQLGMVELASSMSQGLHKVSDQEILNYLDDQNSILAEPVPNNTAALDMNDSDIKTLLGDVPDGELQQYMEEHGRANDIATN